MIQKAFGDDAMSVEMSYNENGRSYGQLVTGSFIMTTLWLMHHILCRVFGETLNHPGDSAPQHLRFGAVRLLAFPKTEITFERKRFQTTGEIEKNTTGQLMVIPAKDFAECFEQWKRCWENSVRSQGACFGRD